MSIVREYRVVDHLSDKRTTRRVCLVREIECEEEGIVQRRLPDISVGGMFIDSMDIFKPGATITARFRLPVSEGQVAVGARVVYVQDEIGTGLEFLDLKSDDKGKIEDLVRRLSSSKRFNSGRVVSRVRVNLPVTLRRRGKNGGDFPKPASIVMLSKNGASVRTEMNVGLETRVVLGLPTGTEFEGRVLGLGKEEIWIQCRGLAHSLGFQFP